MMIAEQAAASQQPYSSLNLFGEGAPIELTANATPDEVDIVIRAVYRQVMGNAHVMESERLVQAESQLRQGNSSVREFVRQVAQSELYRSRFFDNCYRYRAIELNFKHLLGRAPQSFYEMKWHSHVLDSEGFAADIDSYLDSDEYQDAFGEFIVPYYRGHRTQAGQTMLGYTNLRQLFRSVSSSDKSLTKDNTPQLTKAVIRGLPYGQEKPMNVQALIAEALRPKALRSAYQLQQQSSSQTPPSSQTALNTKRDEQAAEITRLQQQLADLQPLLSIGTAMTRGFSVASSTPTAPLSASASFSTQQDINEQAALIEKLQQEIASARPLAAIANAKLNKWRQRYFR